MDNTRTNKKTKTGEKEIMSQKQEETQKLVYPTKAGRSVWYDRHVGIVEVAGSNPASSTTQMLTPVLV
jgi:hypothetical protein